VLQNAALLFPTYALIVVDPQEPTTYQQAITGPSSLEWKAAIQEEYNSLVQTGTWTLVDRPPDTNIVGSKWTFRLKRRNWKNRAPQSQTGCARILPTPRHRFLRNFCPHKSHHLHPCTPLYRSLQRLGNPPTRHHYSLPTRRHRYNYLHGAAKRICHQQQSVQAQQNHLWPQASFGLWSSKFTNTLKSMGFTPIKSDPCLFIRQEPNNQQSYLSIYVDDIILISPSPKIIKSIHSQLTKHYQIKDLGELHHYLGMLITRNRSTRTLTLSQEQYIKTLGERYHMDGSRPISTPMEPGLSLLAAESADLRFPYRELIGSLLYISTHTRPDVGYSVSVCARFLDRYSAEHWNAAKRILRYLIHTPEQKLTLGAVTNQRANILEGYCDSSWAQDLGDRKSTSGFLFTLGGATISWSSRKQQLTALSTAEAELIALCAGAQEEVWISQILSETQLRPPTITNIYQDNQSTISMTKERTDPNTSICASISSTNKKRFLEKQSVKSWQNKLQQKGLSNENTHCNRGSVPIKRCLSRSIHRIVWSN